MTKKEEGIIEGLLDQAFQEAKKATEAYLMKYPNDWFPCGFAWVHMDGRSPVVRVLKKKFPKKAGHPGHPKGWDIWNPSDHPTQCMDAKMAGARAFADVLNQAGYKCYADGRMD